MPRRLITCPVCQTDQHVYKDKLARHRACRAFSVDCAGSGLDVNRALGVGKQIDAILARSTQPTTDQIVYGPDVGRNKLTTPPPPVVPIDCRFITDLDWAPSGATNADGSTRIYEDFVYLRKEDVVRLLLATRVDGSATSDNVEELADCREPR